MQKHGGKQKRQPAKAVTTGSPAPSRRELNRRAFFAKWSKVDWSKQDTELADEIGLTRERIRQIRQQIGAPRSPHHRRFRKTARALEWAKDNLDRIKGLTASELGRKYDLGANWQSGPLYTFLKPYLRDGSLIRKHRWDLMNFRLSNRDLERIWQLPLNMAGSYRRRNRRSAQRWAFKGKHPQFHGQDKLRAYQAAVKAEKQKAAKYFAKA